MKKPTKTSLWDENNEVQDNPCAPSIASSASKRKWARRGLLTIAFGVAPLTCAIFLNGVFAPPASSVGDDASANSLSVNQSLGKARAVEAVSAWLAAQPTPLPGGRVVSWDGYETLVAPEPINSKQKSSTATYDVEVHHLTLATGSGETVIYYDSEIEVHVDQVLGAKITSTPTLILRAPSNTGAWPSESVWTGYPTSDSPQAVQDAVTAWAAAYTSGRPEGLRLSVGDPEAAHSYLPLTGITQATATIIASSKIALPDPEAEPTQMLVRVTLAVVWDGQPVPNPNNPGSTALPLLTYDLLVDDAATAAPRVVSWGGPGSGPSLTAYSTAVDGADVQAAPANQTETED